MASRGRVLIIVQNLPVPFDRRVWLEANTLNNAGYTVSVISPKGQHGKYQESATTVDDIDIYRYPSPPEAQGFLGYALEFVYCWIMTAWLSLKVWHKQGIDVIHACNPPETYFLLAWFYKLWGKKFVFDHHDLSPEMYLAKGGKENGVLHQGLLWLEKLTFKTADVVITTNESHKSIAMKRGNVQEDKIFIVRTGPDFDRLKQLPPEPLLKDGFQNMLCYLGEMCAQDGVDLVLEMAKSLRNVHGREDIKVVLMGGGPELNKLKQLNRDMGLESFVEFKGRVSDHDLCRYLSATDVCLDPDPYTEWSNQSTMNKIMEYMAFSKPTVAFDLRENHYSAREAAVYATPNDVQEFTDLIVDLLDNPEEQQKMGEYGLERVRNELAWDYSKPHLLDAYNKVLSL